MFPTGKPFDMMTRAGNDSNTNVESGLDRKKPMGCLSVFTPSPRIAKISGLTEQALYSRGVRACRRRSCLKNNSPKTSAKLSALGECHR